MTPVPRSPLRRLVPALALTLAPALAAAQSNVIPGTDVSLGALDSLTAVGKVGSYPFGQSAFAMATTSCNAGTVDVPWLAPMDADHPCIAFLIARVEGDGGRLVQVSNYSHLKHGFFATSQSLCSTCQNPSPGTFLGVGCSDTYSTFNNSDNFWLAPAGEVDPWSGDWDPTCSFFDAGLNPTPPFDCDGQRSFSTAQAGALGQLGHRVIVNDAELSFADAAFYYASHYVVPGEPEVARSNNSGHRGFQPMFDPLSPNGWSLSDTTPLVHGTVLDRWPGALVTSATNGGDDGRVWVGAKVTGPNSLGLYRYEYALHNRDNARGVGAVTWPTCSAAPSGFGFRDVDLSLANQWSATVLSGAVRFATPDNPLRWNSIYNFWFESPTPPELGAIELEAFEPGAGASSFSVSTWVPAGAYAVDLGAGCSEFGAPGVLTAGSKPELGQVLSVDLASAAPGGTAALLYGSGVAADLPLGGGCSLVLGGTLGANLLTLGSAVLDSGGAASFPTPVPNDPHLEGVAYRTQALLLTGSATAPLAGVGELSGGLLLGLGNQPVLCP
jgi:hypothetical protein